MAGNEPIRTVVDDLIEILETFGYPVDRQGSYQQGQAYPKSFFTFWNGSTTDGPSHYDNRPIRTIWSFDVNFYSTDPALVEASLLDARDKLREHGWIIDGQGYDVASDEPTHIGRGFEAIFMEKRNTREHRFVPVPEVEFPESIEIDKPEEFSYLRDETDWI